MDMVIITIIPQHIPGTDGMTYKTALTISGGECDSEAFVYRATSFEDALEWCQRSIEHEETKYEPRSHLTAPSGKGGGMGDAGR